MAIALPGGPSKDVGATLRAPPRVRSFSGQGDYIDSSLAVIESALEERGASDPILRQPVASLPDALYVRAEWQTTPVPPDRAASSQTRPPSRWPPRTWASTSGTC